jgi:AcrR family transcriptional regulator
VSQTEGDGAPDPATTRWSEAVQSRATRERGRRTLVKLLDAAVAEFSAHGYHGSRVARVAKRAGTSHGTFYVYFKDKDDLLLAVLEGISAEVDAVLFNPPPFEPGRPGLAVVQAWVRQVCLLFQQHGGILAAVVDAMGDDADPRIAARALENLIRCTGLLAERVRATGSPGIDPDLAAMCMYSLLERANNLVFTGVLHLSVEQLVDGIAEFMQRSVLGVESPSAVHAAPGQSAKG